MRIDWWTLGIQTVNVAVLVWLLQRFFWRPIAATIQQRRATTEAALAAAKTATDDAAAARADIDQTRAGFASEHAAILQQAHDAAGQATAAALDNTARQVATREAAGAAAIATAQQAAETAWAARAGTLAIAIASRLASRLDAPAVQASFLAWLLEHLRTLPEATRQAAAAAPLEAVTATQIDPAEQSRTTALIANALGQQPRIDYRVDNALLAGIELHGPHFHVANSWRADLVAIQAELATADAHDRHR